MSSILKKEFLKLDEKELEIIKSSIANLLAELKQNITFANISEAYLSFLYNGQQGTDVPTIIRFKL